MNTRTPSGDCWFAFWCRGASVLLPFPVDGEGAAEDDRVDLGTGGVYVAMEAGGVGLPLLEAFTNLLFFWVGSGSGSIVEVEGALFLASCFFLRARRTLGLNNLIGGRSG